MDQTLWVAYIGSKDPVVYVFTLVDERQRWRSFRKLTLSLPEQTVRCQLLAQCGIFLLCSMCSLDERIAGFLGVAYDLRDELDLSLDCRRYVGEGSFTISGIWDQFLSRIWG